ncbi:dicarboxylate/amino acid:cation symporter [Dyella caseinilytica]|uniref:Dicarboxylate/amino acid:cation symporter n=1 Tax=Dyella caseinilytica TaxID=1849581 RepID=A0ABX7GWS3_9GAMM|nr:dicarboxylate/amino acid:cation symporter [Dyella caseinilytica]QRN54750.1 dicarboxylate/amino acid:cation symporter [Dyella caseinilytica]GFZ96603.1 dicarboxylate:amino acid:cation symporter DAACS family protein [Dyella caseinilytica]
MTSTKRFSLQMWHQILIAMVLGVAFGHFLGEPAKMLQPLGDIFMALIRMCVVPVVFVSVVTGITSISDMAAMRRIAWKSITIYVISMIIAAALAMAAAMVFKVGAGFGLTVNEATAATAAPVSLKEALMSAIPSNPFKAFAEGALLPTILFAIFFGLAINLAGEKAEQVRSFFESMASVVFKLIGMVLKFAPIGVFGLMAYVTADHGFAVLGHLGSLVAVSYGVMIFFMLVVYSVMLLVFRLNPLPFLRKVFPVQLFAFSSASSAATLPLNMENTQERMGVDVRVTSFVLPLGCTVNMAGLSIYLGIVTVFAANAYGIELTLTHLVMALLTTTLVSVGAAGIPGAALVVMGLVLSAAGLPLEAIAIIAAVDRLLDMCCTAVNVSSDAVTAVMVAKSEGALDEERYYQA